jgi:formiminoglutamase
MSDHSISGWLDMNLGTAPLVLSFPHTGIDIPNDIEKRLVSPWLARKDTDWWIDQLYGFAAELGATTIRTRLSRTVIDVNRDPAGHSLYPGLATTELCPTTTFDGEQLYLSSELPDTGEVEQRRRSYFEPYHRALAEQLDRLKRLHGFVVLYDAHSIRSDIPRLFDGELPNFNIGTNSGASCAPALTTAVEAICRRTPYSTVTNGRFKGGYTTRRYGQPSLGVHALQMELACRTYMAEPTAAAPDVWPPAYDPDRAAPVQEILREILSSCPSIGEKC